MTEPAGGGLSEQDLTDLASGKKVKDFVSGILVQATPEELEATQPMSKQLVEDFGYPKSHIQTRPQFRVKSRPSDMKKEYPVDIAVFKTPTKNPKDLYIIVECKRTGSKEEGEIPQIQNYLAMSTASIGIWTDGVERKFYRKIVKGNEIDVEQIPNLPRMGESIENIGKYLRRNLVAPKHLSLTFKAIRNHLAANNVGTTRDEMLATQLINLVFCKIYDERFTAPDSLVDFRVEIGEDPRKVLQRVKAIFEKVTQKYPDVFDKQDAITLDADAVAYVVGELQPFCLIEAPRDAVGEAFEIFIGSTLKGAQGQFFTPRNVVQLMVEVINPNPADLVIDPACGPAGFLVESLRHKWGILEKDAEKFGWTEGALTDEKISTAIKSIFGIEKDSFLAKVAKAYMTIMGDGKGGIFCADSLEVPNNWPSIVRQNIVLERFDVVLANPPFGKEIKVVGKDKLQQYDLAFKHSNGAKTNQLEKSKNPQVLFVERCIQLAKDGGKIGLILPETYFHAPSARYVTEFIAKHNIIALIDLPHNTFRPFNNAKCIAVIFQKNRPQNENIKMIVAEEMGHNHQGKPLFRYDSKANVVTEELWDDLALASEELKEQREPEYTFEVNAELVISEGIFVPRYYWPKLSENIHSSNYDEIEWKTIRNLENQGVLSYRAGHGSPPAQFKGRGEYPYIRVKDIINWEIYRDPTATIPKLEYEKLTSKYPLEYEDIVYVSRGSYRIGDVAVVGNEDTEVALTREIQILRVAHNNILGLSPYYLLYLLSTPEVVSQTKARIFMDTTLPNIGNRYLDIKLPWNKNPDTRAEIEERVKTALHNKWKAMKDVRGLLSEIRPYKVDKGLDAYEDIFEDSSQLER